MNVYHGKDYIFKRYDFMFAGDSAVKIASCFNEDYRNVSKSNPQPRITRGNAKMKIRSRGLLAEMIK
jgi:hypothetical protein